MVREHSQTVLGGVEVVAGLAGPEQVNAVGPLWGSLAGALHSLPDADVVVDAGRVVAVGTTVLRTLESAVDAGGEVCTGSRETRLFVTPGYLFRVVDLLLTNFHLPRSTLFMLVAAFADLERIQAAYAHAVRERFRFFSYGDACLLTRANAAP